jgi:glutamate formiminotransferase/formiminotetrahydrofolate cyclodeaminase
MSTPIVECIANYSEARRPEVVDAIQQMINSVPGAILLDRHSDNDHNRTVLSFVGSPEAVAEAAFRSIAKAAELINLEKHRGEHPRIGATDVVPFVPISGISMQSCVELAREVGRRVGEELGIPVYLYEEAATRPDRINLEHIRRGEYERLKEEIGVHANRAPDFGPTSLGTAGATVIGARHPLIAYNVYLTSEDVSIAKKIARSVRHSSGGLRYVKALGMLVEGQAQVSMNLTNYKSTPVARVVEFIRREAARYGVGIHSSELVGLIPEDALSDASIWYLQLDGFEPDQILERRLRSALDDLAEPKKTSVDGRNEEAFLDALAAASPTPGGGSASAFIGAAAAALVAMVAGVTIGKKKYAEVEAQMKVILEQAEALRADLTQAVDRDAAAFETVMQAYRMSKNTPEEQGARQMAIQQATWNAAQVPLDVAHLSLEVMELAEQVVARGNINAITDGGTAVVQAKAALTGAGYNVRINVSSLENPDSAHPILEELEMIEERASAIEKRVQNLLHTLGGLPLV